MDSLNKLAKMVDPRPRPDHYIFMHVDEMWGHNDSYYPTVYQFDAYQSEIPAKIAKIIFEDNIMQNVILVIQIMKHYQRLEPEKSKEIMTEELEAELKELQKEPEFLPEYLSLKDLTKALERISQEDGGLLDSFAPGPSNEISETVLIKDNDHVWDQLVKCGLPIDPETTKKLS